MGRAGQNLQWRESSLKLAINVAGYCYAGPLRPPFSVVPAEVEQWAKDIARNWRDLYQKYPTQAAKAVGT
jgi:hypothetical protein